MFLAKKDISIEESTFQCPRKTLVFLFAILPAIIRIARLRINFALLSIFSLLIFIIKNHCSLTVHIKFGKLYFFKN